MRKVPPHIFFEPLLLPVPAKYITIDASLLRISRCPPPALQYDPPLADEPRCINNLPLLPREQVFLCRSSCQAAKAAQFPSPAIMPHCSPPPTGRLQVPFRHRRSSFHGWIFNTTPFMSLRSDRGIVLRFRAPP